jgi:hypothetical protein
MGLNPFFTIIFDPTNFLALAQQALIQNFRITNFKNMNKTKNNNFAYPWRLHGIKITRVQEIENLTHNKMCYLTSRERAKPIPRIVPWMHLYCMLCFHIKGTVRPD